MKWQIKGLGRNMYRMFSFALAYPDWHSYAKDRSTVDAVKRLEKRGLVEVNKHHQYRLAIEY